MKRKLILLAFAFIFIFSTALLAQSTTSDCALKKTKLNVKKLTLIKNNAYTLRVYNMKKRQTVRFTSDDPGIVTLSETTGSSRSVSLTAVNIGSTTVRASIYNKKGRLVRTLKSSIKVTPYAISIKFTQRKVKLYLDDTMKLSTIIKPATSQELPLFESSDADIVSINSKGIISAIAPGEVTITATLMSSGQKAECLVTVVLPPIDEVTQIEP